ncbi:MAG: M1 family aminopeptidase [Bacteroidota bacterium]
MNKYLGISVLMLAILLTRPFKVQAQTIHIKSKIIDKQTSEPIPFAHILIEGTQIGAISDLYGSFVLNYPEYNQAGVLKVSCLGYKTARVPLKNIALSILEIMIEQNAVELQEIVVSPENPLELLKEAFQKIPENYDTTSVKLGGYYKISALLNDKNIRYTEAFIDIVKFPYQPNNNWEDSILLHEARTKASEIDDWKLRIMLPWEKHIHQLSYRDIVKEFISKKNVFKKFLVNNHFEIEKMVSINGRKAYMIQIKPKKYKKNANWGGYIFLDEETKAIVKIDIVSANKLLKKLKADIKYILASKLYKVRYTQGEWKESINYALIGNKWYFKEVNSSKHFLISSKKREMVNEPVTVSLHYATDSIKRNFILSDTINFLQRDESIADYYKASFWNEFDRQRGVISGDVFVTKGESFTPKKEPYTFSKLDTLQGPLTPIRTCFDVGFYHLDVEVLPKEEILRGSSLIRFRVINPTDRIQIDLYSGMSVDSILYQGKVLNFEREYNAVYIDFPYKLKIGAIEEIKVYFSGHPVDYNPEIPMYASFLWVEDLNRNPWLQAICQGYGASGWWPNKDHLSDEPDSAAISITVPSNLEVVSNGRLQQKTPLSSNRMRFDWEVSYHINNYNLTLNAGGYTHFQDIYVSKKDTLDLDYYVMTYNLKTAQKKVDMVKPMLATYEKYFGPYPFPNDGFKLVETPHAMEHQSCVAIGFDYFSTPEDTVEETSSPDFTKGMVDFQVVIHEAAHEWWGNNVSCTDNAELWIHEAFATYAEALYIEDHYGYDNSQAYINAMKKSVKNKTPVIGKFNVNHIHYDIGDMYNKGALMLNTLRHVIDNDSLWFSILKGIQLTFKYQQVTTENIVNFINQKTGTDYTYFFHQYLRSIEIPQLEVFFEYKKEKAYLNYRWLSTRKAFKMPVKYILSKGTTHFLYPTHNWQKMEFSKSEIADFKVNTDQFYIEVVK